MIFHKLLRKQNGGLPDEIDMLEDLGDIQIIRFKGILDKTTISEDSFWGEKFIEKNHLYSKDIIVDLKNVKHVDSAALALCLLRLQQFKKHGHKIALINVPEEFRRLAEIEKVSLDISIFDSEAKALAALRG